MIVEFFFAVYMVTFVLKPDTLLGEKWIELN
jgi:hypothetical protein